MSKGLCQQERCAEAPVLVLVIVWSATFDKGARPIELVPQDMTQVLLH
jgi:hypothetical protein